MVIRHQIRDCCRKVSGRDTTQLRDWTGHLTDCDRYRLMNDNSLVMMSVYQMISKVVDGTHRIFVTSPRRLYLPSVIRVEGYIFRICQRLNREQSSFCIPRSQFADILFLEEIISQTCSGACEIFECRASADSQRLSGRLFRQDLNLVTCHHLQHGTSYLV